MPKNRHKHALFIIFGPKGGTLGPTLGHFSAHLGIIFAARFPGPFSELLSSRGPAAVVRRLGGGIPSDIPGKGVGRKSHTPSGQSRTGAADILRASPPAAGPHLQLGVYRSMKTIKHIEQLLSLDAVFMI